MGPGFPNYPADNIRAAKCNAQQTEMTRVFYTSKVGFKGKDQARLEVFFPNGRSIKTNVLITVK